MTGFKSMAGSAPWHILWFLLSPREVQWYKACSVNWHSKVFHNDYFASTLNNILQEQNTSMDAYATFSYYFGFCVYIYIYIYSMRVDQFGPTSSLQYTHYSLSMLRIPKNGWAIKISMKNFCGSVREKVKKIVFWVGMLFVEMKKAGWDCEWEIVWKIIYLS